jgi:hypothetical protein
MRKEDKLADRSKHHINIDQMLFSSCVWSANARCIRGAECITCTYNNTVKILFLISCPRRLKSSFHKR